MTIPSSGFRRLMIPVDQSGNEVGIVFDGTTFRLAVDAVIAGPVVIGAVELDDGGGGGTRAQIKADGSAFNAGPNDGGQLIAGQDDTGPTQRNLRVNSSGHLIVSVGASTPGTVITTPADVAVGIAATVPLPAPPVGATRGTVQNTGPAGTFLRVREVGGAPGTGFILPRFASKTFGGEDGALGPLEVEEVIAGIATSAMIQYEGP